MNANLAPVCDSISGPSAIHSGIRCQPVIGLKIRNSEARSSQVKQADSNFSIFAAFNLESVAVKPIAAIKRQKQSANNKQYLPFRTNLHGLSRKKAPQTMHEKSLMAASD
jgi:hypothetical protein